MACQKGWRESQRVERVRLVLGCLYVVWALMTGRDVSPQLAASQVIAEYRPCAPGGGVSQYFYERFQSDRLIVLVAVVL